MWIKTRLEKLEQRLCDDKQLDVIILQSGMNQDEALDDWKLQTGKDERGLIVFIQRFSK